MTTELILLSAILGIATLLFISGWIRMDLTAFIVLIALAVTGLISSSQAISGFSNSAVVISWCMYILSAGLTKTGISNLISRQLIKLANGNEAKLIGLLMLASGLLSAIMFNIGVVAMFLPITLEIARRTKISASRLLLPMDYGVILGGMTLLIGTTTHLIVQDIVVEANLAPIGFLDFLVPGMIIFIFSLVYFVFIGRRFLPDRKVHGALSTADPFNGNSSSEQYGLQERLAILEVGEINTLIGKSISESRIGRALGLTILSIQRKNKEMISITPETLIERHDRLLVLGRLDRINELCQKPFLLIEDIRPITEQLLCEGIKFGEFLVSAESELAQKTISELEFRQKYNVNILAVQYGGIIRRTNFQYLRLEKGDRLLVVGHENHIAVFEQYPGFCWLSLSDVSKYNLDERLLSLHIPEGSSLVGKTLEESRLGVSFGITVLRILQNTVDTFLPDPTFTFQANDWLVVEGRQLDIEVLRGLQSLVVDRDAKIDLEELTSGSLQMSEVMLSPFSVLEGKKLREIRFREKYGVTVLAIWRGNRAFRTGLGELKLQHGDAFLCYGKADDLRIMAGDRNFVVLKMDLQEETALRKAPIAALIMAAVVLVPLFTDISITIMAIAGAISMVLTGVLTMEKAYESIEWRSIFIMATLLPLGTAIQKTGAAALVGHWVINLIGDYGPTAILAGLMAVIIVAKLILPSTVLAVVMTPIAISTALDLGISPYAYVVGVGFALAASFISPLAHPINTMVMTPGGYRYSDFVKHGLPISLIVILVSILLLPILFPY